MAAEGEQHDGEYSDEAGMAKDQLTSAERAASELHDLLDSDEDLPEWVQAKITKAVDYLNMANTTMKSRHDQGDVHKMSEAEKPDHMDQAMEEEEVTDEGNEFTGALAKAKASNQDHFEVDGKKYTVKEAEMSRAAKGHEKYGKEGMKALAKAGKEGKDLDKIRDKYNKYDESVESGDKKECPPMSHIKKMCQDGKTMAEICKMHPDCNQNELKQMVADCKMKMEEVKKAKPDFLDMDKDGDKEESMKKAAKDKEQKVSEDIAWLQAVAGIRAK
jgi:hypothetical protein